jgi:Protein of unknown function (DUF3352)
MGVLPHFIPPCNTIVVTSPTFLEFWTDVRRDLCDFQPVSPWDEMGGTPAAAQESVQSRFVNGVLRRSGARPTLGAPFRRTMWKGFRQGLRRDSLAMLRAAALLLTCAVTALTAAACGSSASSGEGDPAALVPAGAPIYAQAAIQPEGERRDDALAAIGKVMRTDDPAGELRELIDKELAEDGLTWEKDFAPWLGEEAGIWASDLGADVPNFAAIVQTTDVEKARAAVQRFKETGDETFTKKSHAGTDYEVNTEGMAVGFVDDFLVLATEAAFKRTADMAEGGDSLADSDRYKDTLDDLEDDRLGNFYLDTKQLMDAALAEDPEAAQQLQQFKSIFQFDKLGPTAGSLQADGDRIALDTVTTGLPEGAVKTATALLGGSGSELLGELPGDAWGAFAVPKVGEAAKSLFSAFAGAIGGAAVSAQLKQQTGLDLEQDVFSWIGDVGVFVRGASEPELDGALVIQSTDDGKASAAFGKIVGLIGKEEGAKPDPVQIDGAESAFSFTTPDAEKPIVLARGSGKVVAAYGEYAAKAALSSSQKLGDSELYGDAKDALGDAEPSLLLSMPAIVTLVDAIGEADADWDKAKPYLESLNAIASGGKVDGDKAKSRFVVTLK